MSSVLFLIICIIIFLKESFENTLFSVLKNRKQKTSFGCRTCFPVFLFWRIENCYRKQLSNRPLFSSLEQKFSKNHILK